MENLKPLIYIVSNMHASSITGTWNIRVKSNGFGSIINVNITNLSGYKEVKNLYNQVTSTKPLILKSTRIFESELVQAFK